MPKADSVSKKIRNTYNTYLSVAEEIKTLEGKEAQLEEAIRAAKALKKEKKKAKQLNELAKTEAALTRLGDELKVVKDQLGRTRKSFNTAKKSLGKAALSHRDLFAAEGLDLNEFALGRTEVRKYGVIGRIVTFDASGIPLRAEDTHEAIMRAKHEYYNMLLDGLAPVREEALRLLRGPKWDEAVKLQNEIEAVFKARHGLKEKLGGAKNNEKARAELEALLNEKESEIKLLREKKSILQKELKEERKAKREEYKDRLRELERGPAYNNAVKAVRNQISPGSTKEAKARPPLFKNASGHGFFLQDGDYSEVEDAVKLSFQKALEADWVWQGKSHYRYEGLEGARPESILDYERWNHEGTVTVGLSQTDKKTLISDVTGGKSRWISIRKAMEEDLRIHRVWEKFSLDKQKTREKRIQKLESLNSRTENQERELSRLREAYKRNDSSTWCVATLLTRNNKDTTKRLLTHVLFNFHRPLSENENDRIREVTIHSKKVGRRLTKALTFTVTKEPTEFCSSGQSGEVIVKPVLTEELLGEGRKFIPCIDIIVGTEQKRIFLPKIGYREKGADGKRRGDTKFVELEALATRVESLQSYRTSHAQFALAMFKSNEDENREALQWTHPTLGNDYDYKNRSRLRYAFYEWRRFLDEKHGEDFVRSKIRSINEVLRTNYHKDEKFKAEGGAYGRSYFIAHADVCDLLMHAFDLSKEEADVLAVLVMYMERERHLEPWATNLQERILARRTEFYRVLASRLAKKYASIVFVRLPQAYIESKEKGNARKLLGASSLESALRNAASSHHVKFSVRTS